MSRACQALVWPMELGPESAAHLQLGLPAGRAGCVCAKLLLPISLTCPPGAELRAPAALLQWLPSRPWEEAGADPAHRWWCAATAQGGRSGLCLIVDTEYTGTRSVAVR